MPDSQGGKARRRVFPFLWLWRVGPRKGHLRWVLRWWIADRRQRRAEERRHV